eukprot:scaffold16438_cov144-Isochrysis_galbana.AAC.5
MGGESQTISHWGTRICLQPSCQPHPAAFLCGQAATVILKEPHGFFNVHVRSGDEKSESEDLCALRAPVHVLELHGSQKGRNRLLRFEQLAHGGYRQHLSR